LRSKVLESQFAGNYVFPIFIIPGVIIYPVASTGFELKLTPH